MAMVSASCSKCNQVGKLDIGKMSKIEVINALTKQESFHCFGNHVELCSPIDYWTINWDTLEDAKAPTEEEFLQGLVDKYNEVYTKDMLEQKYEIVGFAYGMCITESKANGENKTFDFVHSPTGKRYYIA